MENGYERTYGLVKQGLADCDLREAAARLGYAAPENGKLAVSFLGRDYRISNEEVVCTDGTESRAIEKSLLIYYITSKGSGEPAQDYIFPAQMIGSVGISAKEKGLSWQMSPLEKEFSGKAPEQFFQVMRQFGAKTVPSEKPGTYVWQYRVFPRIMARIFYDEADEEFPCIIRIKFDSGIRRYLEFEQAAFLQGCIVKTIRDTAKKNRGDI